MLYVLDDFNSVMAASRNVFCSLVTPELYQPHRERAVPSDQPQRSRGSKATIVPILNRIGTDRSM